MLQAWGYSVRYEQLFDLLDFVSKICPWFPEKGKIESCPDDSNTEKEDDEGYTRDRGVNMGSAKKLTTEAQQMVEKQDVAASPSIMFLAMLALPRGTGREGGGVRSLLKSGSLGRAGLAADRWLQGWAEPSAAQTRHRRAPERPPGGVPGAATRRGVRPGCPGLGTARWGRGRELTPALARGLGLARAPGTATYPGPQDGPAKERCLASEIDWHLQAQIWQVGESLGLRHLRAWPQCPPRTASGWERTLTTQNSFTNGLVLGFSSPRAQIALPELSAYSDLAGSRLPQEAGGRLRRRRARRWSPKSQG
ncbi:uncharacterized protein LOC132228364 [Myotis daubentonii]|uniref:uncharacterized protein LOC132228364 n=1 Tax=Myotis daubentonii TaxID=98922 RepID=UPI002873249A|nr:uncharacterized protein LOC132228364 [Myotis daubentonii]